MARFNRGYVKIHRSAIEGDIGNNLVCLGIFTKLIGRANLEPTTIRWNGKPRVCDRGSVVISIHGFAEEGEINVKTLRKHLKYLSERIGSDSSPTIIVESSREGTIITIPNYDKYHRFEDSDEGDDGPCYGPPRGPPDGQPSGGVSGPSLGCVSTPLLNNKERRKNTYPPKFEEIWNNYPNGGLNKSNAFKRYKNQIKTAEKENELCAAIENYNRLLKIQTWRSPKQFDSFLGTERSGFFWEQFVNPPPSMFESTNSEKPKKMTMLVSR